MGRLIVHVGYPKVASTFLQDQILQNSPSVTTYTGDGGALLGIRDDSEYARFGINGRVEELQRLYEKAVASKKPTVISHESLCIGNWMCGYDYCEDPEVVTERIRSYLPTAEIMLILRPQSSWFASWYRQHVSGGSVCSAEEMLETDTWNGCVRQGLELDRKVKHYYDTFSPDRVKLFFFSDLVRNQAKFVQDIFEFFGANTPQDYPHAPLNATRSDPLVRAKLVSNRISGSLRDRLMHSQQSKEAWDRRHHSLWKFYINRSDIIVRHFAKKTTIDKQLQKRLDDMFAESNLRLEELTGIDLSQKGFHVAARDQ